MLTITQRPFLNLGSGRVILPAPKPAHYGLVDDQLVDFALWHNVDRNAEPGVDEVVDLFAYPWPWPENAFAGALAAHIVEHIPHEIRLRDESLRAKELAGCQDGWWAWFGELHRVLTPGAVVHILSPYAWSAGAVGDPSHTRFITEQTLLHSMQPNPDAPFDYATGGAHFELVEAPRYAINPMFGHLIGHPERLQRALITRLNVVSEVYVKLRVVK
jgi:hypothetical protein